ncbi:MAG: hypothetical protein ACKVU1_15340 [bacterium]
MKNPLMTPSTLGTQHARKTRRTHLAVALLVALAALSACGSNDLVILPSEQIADGWSQFRAGNYERADAFFLAALATDSTLAEAHSGLGWSRAFAGDLDAARDNFTRALIFAPADTDALAGAAAVAHALGNRADAITNARSAVERDLAWTFAHRAGIDVEDLRLILAQALALEGSSRYAEVQIELDVLNPDNGLTPGNASSWVVGSAVYASYGEALLAALEDVEVRVGAGIPR